MKLNVTMKKVAVGLGVSSLLVMGACSPSDGGESVFKMGENSYTESALLDQVQVIGGTDLIMQAMLTGVLSDVYTVKDSEIEKRITDLKEQMGGDEQFNMYLAQQGMNEDGLKGQVRTNVLTEKALTDMNGVTDEAIQERYEELKNGVEGVLVNVNTMDEANKAKKLLEEGKTVEELQETFEEGNVMNETFEPMTTGDYLMSVFDTKEGEVTLIENQENFYVIRTDKITETPLEELEPQIKQELLYEGVNSIGQVLKYVVEENDIEFQGEYKTIVDEAIKKAENPGFVSPEEEEGNVEGDTAEEADKEESTEKVEEDKEASKESKEENTEEESSDEGKETEGSTEDTDKEEK